jgi:hypothetical protein
METPQEIIYNPQTKQPTPAAFLAHRWKPGESGQKKIRRKPDSFKFLLEKIGDEKLHEDPLIDKKIKRRFAAKRDIRKKMAILYGVYILALKGAPWALHFIADRTEGKPKETIALVDETVLIDVQDDPDEAKVLEGEISEETGEADNDIAAGNSAGDCTPSGA